MAKRNRKTSDVVRYVTHTFFQGLIALLPIVITIYLLGLLAWWLEATVGGALTMFLASPEEVQEAIDQREDLIAEVETGDRDPEALQELEPVPVLRYIPGMGLAVTVLLVFLFGLLLKVYMAKRFYSYAESLMQRVPVVKSIYGATKDFLAYFSSTQEQQMNQVVLIQLPGTEKKLLGLMTRESFEDLPEEFGGEQTVAVYLPMSYQIGGYTLILPRDQVEPVDMSIEDGLRFALTAGISEQRKSEPMIQTTDAVTPPVKRVDS